MVFKTNILDCQKTEELIECDKVIYRVKEFNVYNLGTDDVKIQFNHEGDVLTLEPGEGFNTNEYLQSATVLTVGAKVKYSYWIG